MMMKCQRGRAGGGTVGPFCWSRPEKTGLGLFFGLQGPPFFFLQSKRMKKISENVLFLRPDSSVLTKIALVPLHIPHAPIRVFFPH